MNSNVASVEPGSRFGKLTAIQEVSERQGYHRLWKVRCDCGTTIEVRLSELRRRTRSCGCTGGRPRLDDGIDRGYPRAHANVRRERGPANHYGCTDCEEQADTWSYVRGCLDELTSPIKPTNEGSSKAPHCPHVEHYQPRCYSCHTRLDGSPVATARSIRAGLLNRL